ncbi:MAG: hypothetical protein H6621_00185, partial [Halobacteriovoraceae bacterium]|nr:hypothetical protein [Halobacteriovoraceae bacterium]
MLINSFFKVAKVVPVSLRPVCLMSTNKPGGKAEKTWKDRDTAQEKDFFNKEDGCYISLLKFF